MIQSKLKNAFKEHNGILTTELAKKLGINDSTLRKAVERDAIKRYCKGVYFLDDVYEDDLYLLQLRYKKGVYSHDTAMMLHDLTTFSPFVYHFTFPRGYHLQSAREQSIEPHYVDPRELMNEYITVLDSWESNPIRVTNLEKTIIDSLRCENLMTFMNQEMIHNYIDREDKNINKLIKYAERFNVIDVVEKEVLSFVE